MTASHPAIALAGPAMRIEPAGMNPPAAPRRDRAMTVLQLGIDGVIVERGHLVGVRDTIGHVLRSGRIDARELGQLRDAHDRLNALLCPAEVGA